MLLVGAALLGIGSSVFHPESSRVARMAAGGAHGLAQSLFQVGGNIGSALGPLAAALVVVRWGQSSLAFFALLALLSCAILWNVGVWYKHHGLARLSAAARAQGAHAALAAAASVQRGIAVLLVLIFSKYVYLASLTSYYTFYLIHRFGCRCATRSCICSCSSAAVAVGTVARRPVRRPHRPQARHLVLDPGRRCRSRCCCRYANLFWTGPLAVVDRPDPGFGLSGDRGLSRRNWCRARSA